MRFERIKNIYKRLLKYKNVIETIKDLHSMTFPSIFISSYKDFAGILSPIDVKDIEVYDNPPAWYSKRFGIEDILNIRARVIYARASKERILEDLREIGISLKPVDVEIKFSKKPRFLMIFDLYHKPIGNPTLIESLRYDDIKTDRIIEKVINDDLKARDAIAKLYERGISIYTIQRIFSLGLLGIKIRRKIVPTRYSITAVDSILSEHILRSVKKFETISDIFLFRNNYLGNHYYIILLPDKWEYELIEIIYKNNIPSEIYHDYETFKSRSNYAENTAGGYYAAKLAVLEYLNKIRRQASVIIFRKIYTEESLALGVWKVRETCRNAFKNEPIRFESLKELIEYLKKDLSERILMKSKILLKNLFQKRLI